MLIVVPPLAALVVASAVAASQPPAPSSAVSGTQKQEQAAQYEPKADAGHRSAAPSVVVNVGTAQAGAVQTSGKSGDEEEHTSNERIIAGATVALAVITAGLAWFTGLLWGSTKELVKDSGDTARTGLRAYVKASPVPPGIEFGELIANPNLVGITCKIEIKNYGQTPANVTGVIVKTIVLPKGQELPDVPDYSAPDPDFSGHFLAKDEPFYKTHGEYGSIAKNLSEIQSGELSLFIYGYIDYIDAFDRRHRTGFARVYAHEFDDITHYKSDADFAARSNILLVKKQREYVYDRLRKKGEGDDWDEKSPA